MLTWGSWEAWRVWADWVLWVEVNGWNPHLAWAMRGYGSYGPPCVPQAQSGPGPLLQWTELVARPRADPLTLLAPGSRCSLT